MGEQQNKSSFALIKILYNHPLCDFPSNSSNWSQHHGESLDDLQQYEEPNGLVVFSIFLSLFNAVANGFSFSIFRNKAFNNSIMSVLLLGLSLFEVAFQLGQAFYYSANTLRDCCLPPLRSRTLAVALSAVAGVTRQMSATFQLARNWTLAALSLYRYEAVCRSMARVKLFRKEASVRIVVMIGVMCTLIMLPRLFEAYEAVCYHPEARVYVLKTTRPYLPVLDNDVYRLFYLSVCLFILQSGGPTITVLICSAFVLKVLWARKRFRETQNMRQRQTGTDKLIIMLALTFFVLEMPAFFSKLLFSFQAISPETDHLLSQTTNTLITLDSSLNIFIYLFSNPTFLQVTKKRLCRGRCAQEDNNNGEAGAAATKRTKAGDGCRGGSNEETARPSPPVRPAAAANAKSEEAVMVAAAAADDDEEEENFATERQALMAEADEEAKAERAAAEAEASARAAVLAAAAAAAVVVDGTCDFCDADGNLIELRVTEV